MLRGPCQVSGRRYRYADMTVIAVHLLTTSAARGSTADHLVARITSVEPTTQTETAASAAMCG